METGMASCVGRAAPAPPAMASCKNVAFPCRGPPSRGRRAECLAAAAQGLAGKDAFHAPTLTRQDRDAVPSP